MTDHKAGVRLAPIAGFDHINDWVFDLDNTLYPATSDLFAEIDTRMTAFVADFLDLHPIAARAVQKDYYKTHGTTLSGLMKHHQMDPADFLFHVHEIDLSPLPHLPELVEAIGELPGRKFVYTNGSRRHAERVTAHMKLDHLFDGSFGIEDANYIPKPHQSSYDDFCEVHNVDPTGAIFFEDLARNLTPAKEMGFTTVLVHSEKDWSHEPIEARPASLADVTGDDGPGHIDYVTGDLSAFLDAALKSLNT